MAKPYTITITDGTGTSDVLNDTYTVTASSTGYDNTTISPSSLTVVDGTDSYAFTIAATGSLVLHVTEDGTSSGTPVVGAVFYRTDSSGTTYGSSVTTDSSGNATLSNLPYATTGAPTVYYIQTASDGNHEFTSTVQSTNLTTSSTTIEIENTPAATRTFTLTDTNYTNLSIGTATITLS